MEVDISKITDNTTLTLPVIISDGITKVTPQLVKATVVVNKAEVQAEQADQAEQEKQSLVSLLKFKGLVII